MDRQPEYRLYATLLDAFTDYLNSDNIYERYWGWSDNPPLTPEEFRQKQFEELIGRINRVPFDSEAADRGTAFNEVVDCLIEHRKSDTVQVERVYKMEREGACDNFGNPMYYEEYPTNEVIALKVTYKERAFTFPISLCREFANYYQGALTQLRVEAILPTCFGDVLVYGVIDELMPMSVHDIKTTSSYYVGKYRDHWQHVVYPYCLMQGGSDVRLFEYNVTDFKQTYTESYTFVPERDIPRLTEHCEDFIRFLNDNRNLITDKKIFGE